MNTRQGKFLSLGNLQYEKTRIIQLDSLRFFAVLSVLIGHWLQWQWSNPFLQGVPFDHGVTLFFVLSGFLITKILLINKKYYFENKLHTWGLIKAFFMRRVLRIFPIYYLLIFGLAILNYENTREIFPWIITYSSNIYQSIHNEYVGNFNHFWSLGVEEQFYLFWPFLILLIPFKRMFSFLIFSILIGILSKFISYHFVGNWMATSYFTLCCFASLGVGALLGYIQLNKETLFKKVGTWSFILTTGGSYLLVFLICVKFEIHWFREIFDDTLFSIVCAGVIACASNNGFKGWIGKILSHRFITYGGEISYGIYLFHLFIPSLYQWFMFKVGISVHNKYLVFLLMFVLTYFLAHLSWRFIEAPLNRLKSRFPYR